MPATARCPTCKTPTKVPADAEPGTTLTCPGCEEQFVPGHLKVKAKRGVEPNSDDDDGEGSYEARKPQGEEAPREREDGYGKDLRKKKRRRRREPEPRGGRLFEGTFSDTAGWIGLAVIDVFIVGGLAISSLGVPIPKAGYCCVGVLAVPLLLIARFGQLLGRR